jgi:two-component system, NarL family, nitrate/nitrite response regulator NarL
MGEFLPEPVEKDLLRVVVVDDHPMMRDGIIQALRSDPSISIVGEGQSAEDALAVAKKLLPDVILLDMNMPGGGLAALSWLADQCPTVTPIVITVREDEETVGEALRSGARGYMLKGISGTELVANIHAIHRGEIHITPALAARLLAAETTGRTLSSRHRLAMLSEREIDILRHLSRGCGNKEIAAEFGLSEKTIKNYVSNILQKLQVRNRVEAAILVAKTDCA